MGDSRIVAVGLGSNLGERRGHLDYAAGQLAAILSNLRLSPYIAFEAVDMRAGAPPFLNAAAVGQTTLTARALLDALLTIERARGRDRPFANASRTLDLDLLLYGDAVIAEPGLLIPHPRFRERPFVLEPLSQIAPDLVDPVSGLTIRDLWLRAG